jgi:hypothetical protein
MPTPKERLSHLLELAASGAGEHGALAGEVADLLLDWPSQYPAPMRATFEALLEKIVREMAPETRAPLAARFEGRDEFPLALLNEFFLFASPAMRETILARNEAAGPAAPCDTDCAALLAALRARRELAPELAELTGVPAWVADAAATDVQALCVLARGAGINRATFSAIAILAGPARAVHENFQMLTAFDHVPENGARQLVQFWRARGVAPAAVEQAA